MRCPSRGLCQRRANGRANRLGQATLSDLATPEGRLIMAAMMLVVNSTVRERASNRTRDASTARLPITTTSNGKGRTIYPLSTTTLLNIYSKSSP